MLWDSSLNAGFSAATPWLPVAPDYQTVNVQAQRDDPASMLTLYHRLIALRRATPALAVGAYTAVEAHGDVLAYMRTHAGKRFLVVLNLGAQPHTFASDQVATPGTRRTLHLSRSCRRGRTPHDYPARGRGRNRDVSVREYRDGVVVCFLVWRSCAVRCEVSLEGGQNSGLEIALKPCQHAGQILFAHLRMADA